MFSLKRKLDSWVRQGLLSEEQANAIQRAETRADGHGWIVYGIGATGVIAIATGVVSLVAANWEAIPEVVKVMAYFALQLGLGGLVVGLRNKLAVWREIAVLAFALFFFAGIGLFAQIYHLSGAPWRALAFWEILAMPAMLMSRTRVLAVFWIGGMFWAVGMYISPWGREHDFFTGILTTSALMLVPAFWRSKFNPFPLEFGDVVRWLCIPFTLLAASVYANVLWHESSLRHLNGVFYFTAALLLGVIACLASSPPYGRRVMQLFGATVAILIGSILLPSLPLVQEAFPHSGIAASLTGAVFFGVTWGIAAVLGIAAGERRLFNLASIVVSIRIVVAYFEVFGDLAYTGFGLILSGVVILGVAAVWYRQRERLARWMGGLS
jgi:uncharacterized membrane protein